MRHHRRDDSRSEVILGFDIRELWLPLAEEWPHDRVQDYCLQDVSSKPLSVDHLVWPSVFELSGSEWLPASGLHGRLWTSLGTLWERFDQLQIEHETRAISITLIWDSHASRNETIWSSVVRPTCPDRVNPAWVLLGYDVADQWLLSGLLNCGYSNDERKRLQSCWSSRLNAHHLFNGRGDALEFINVCNARVPEHAPFFAYALYGVRRTEKRGLRQAT